MRKLVACCMAAIMVMSCGVFAFADVAVAEPNTPTGVTVDANGTVYVVDSVNNCIQTMKAGSDTWTKLAGKTLTADVYGEAAGDYLDGVAEYALFNGPTDIVKFMDGYAVSDTENNVIRYIAGTSVKTLAGSTKAGLQDGSGAGAAFNMPTGLAVDASGNLYIADTGNDAVRMMGKDGLVKTIVSGLSAPRGLAWADGKLYIADSGNQRILEYADGKVFKLAGNTDYTVSNVEGNPVEGGYIDGAVNEARFSNPVGIAVDTARGLVFVGDCGNNAIRVIENGKVSTLIQASALDLEQFPSEPMDLTIANNMLYVADADAGIITLDLSKLVASPAANLVFSDVAANAWYNEAVTYAYGNGLFNGVSATAFGPQTSMTRGMFVTVISRLYNATYAGELIGGDSHFIDVADGQYYAKPCSWAADQGIVSGVGGNMFAPNQSITRQQMAVIMYGYAKMLGQDVKITSDATAAFNAMPDAASVASWAKDAVTWAVGNKIINGKDGNLAPNATATRAEVAQIIYNFAK